MHSERIVILNLWKNVWKLHVLSHWLTCDSNDSMKNTFSIGY